MHAFRLHNNKSYLTKKDKCLTWKKSLLHNQMYPQVDEATNKSKEVTSILKKTTMNSLKPKQNSSTNLSICGDCTMQEAANTDIIQPGSCRDCKVSFENLTQPSHLLLQYHNKLDHINFDAIRALARQGFLPKSIVNGNKNKNICMIVL